MNYIKIVNWFWEEIPFFEGFKTSYGFLFFAILDSINKNKWQAKEIAYELIITKSGLAKRSYLESRDWLVKNNLIKVIPGKNLYQMARFELGAAVQNCTSIDTSASTAINTETMTATAPLSAPINNKHINI